MLKFPFVEWTWLYQHRREYSGNARGDLSRFFKWAPYYEPGKYDLAILHLDQGCVEDGILARGKGSVYKQLNEVIQDIPKIVIMHGTPFYPEAFENKQDIIDRVNSLIGENYKVVNSHRALEQWGWQDDPKARVIIHGMDPEEWPDLPKEPRVVTMISPAGFPAYYDRTFLEYVREGLAERDIIHCHITVDWNAKDFDDYRNFLGRSMIYFNPTRESPMPRARTEAMLCGACVITTPHHGAGEFIRDGENGFLIPRRPEVVVKLIEDLINDPERAVKIGRAGKKTARELFGWTRFQNDWKELMEQVLYAK